MASPLEPPPGVGLPVSSRDASDAYARYTSLLLQASSQLFVWQLTSVLVLTLLFLASIFLAPSPLSTVREETFITPLTYRFNYVLSSLMQSLIITLIGWTLGRFFRGRIAQHSDLYEGRFIFLKQLESRYLSEGFFTGEWHRMGTAYFQKAYSLIGMTAIIYALVMGIFLVNILKNMALYPFVTGHP